MVVCVRGGKWSGGEVRGGRMWGCDDGKLEGDVTWDAVKWEMDGVM